MILKRHIWHKKWYMDFHLPPLEQIGSENTENLCIRFLVLKRNGSSDKPAHGIKADRLL